MGVGEVFKAFCGNITVDTYDDISYRYRRMVKQLNIDFWSTDSNASHGLYVGSFGRNTAIRGISDIDMLFQLPYSIYERYNAYAGNGQSALLQAVRQSIKNTYSVTDIGGDGQVVVVPFTDGIVFEVLPAFINKDDISYTYPNSNDGGSWRVTNPRAEIEAIRAMNTACNDNLKWLCRMMRVWKDHCDVPISSFLIDTLAYYFIKEWQYRDFLLFLSNQDENKSYWLAPGSSSYVYKVGNFQYKAKQGYNNALEGIDKESAYPLSAKAAWRKIYGSRFL